MCPARLGGSHLPPPPLMRLRTAVTQPQRSGALMAPQTQFRLNPPPQNCRVGLVTASVSVPEWSTVPLRCCDTRSPCNHIPLCPHAHHPRVTSPPLSASLPNSAGSHA
uniref:Uncharacterized protein n=1 Tax=Denticeps clupeoides TaxID=299321 RepID=A0AAY4E3G0_9TELE